MKRVSTARVTRRKIVTTVLGALVATAAVQGTATAQAPQPPPAPVPVIIVEEKPANHWIATGFIGSAFSASGNVAFGLSDTADGGVTFGGQLARFWGYGGVEILADFQPSFEIANLALADHPSVNANMLNAILKGAWGSNSQFQPYISGGLGWMTMRTSTFTLAGSTIVTTPVTGTTLVALNTIDNTQSKFASDIGGGVYVFASRWGVRGDVRYFDASTFDAEKLNNGTFANDFTQALVSGLSFWRANVGVAYRW